MPKLVLKFENSVLKEVPSARAKSASAVLRKTAW